MKYTTEFNQSLFAAILLLTSFNILPAQESIQTRQDSLVIVQSANAIQEQKGLKMSISERDEIVRSIVPTNGCTIPKTAKRDREFDCLKGNVHIVRSESAGLVKKDGQYIKDSVSQERVVTYDKQGNKIERLVYGFDHNRNKKIDSRVVYKFNQKGVATGWEDYVVGYPIPARSIYTYDNKGNRIKQTTTGIDGEVRAIVTLIYDLKGNNIEKKYFYSETIYNRYKEINEFEGENLIQTTNYNKDGSITSKIVFTYENGNKKEVVGYSLDAENKLVRANRTSLSYDTAGNLIEEIVYNKDDSIKNRFVYGYDAQGNVISSIAYAPDGNILWKASITLEFDSHGNWIKYITNYTNSAEGTNARESYSIETRTITYY